MRVTKILGDKYFDDRPRRVTINDAEVADWVVADMFRRVVQTADKTLNGAVWIEPLPEPVEAVADEQEVVLVVSAPQPEETAKQLMEQLERSNDRNKRRNY